MEAAGQSWDTEAIFFPESFLVEASVAGWRSTADRLGWVACCLPGWAWAHGPVRVGKGWEGLPACPGAASIADPALATSSQALLPAVPAPDTNMARARAEEARSQAASASPGWPGAG